MKFKQTIYFLFVLLNTAILYPDTHRSIVSKNVEYISDTQLIRLAFVKGLIPARLSEAYMEGIKKNKQDILNWVIADRKSKVELILNFMDYFDEQDITITNAADQYVDKMNVAVYKMIQDNPSEARTSKNSLIGMFKKIAALDGDFAVDGKSSIECLREALGPKGLKEFKASDPQKYKYFEDLDK